jgi:hypothetical protein
MDTASLRRFLKFIRHGAERMPDDTDGFIRLDGNAATACATLAENRPELVRDPPFRQELKALPLEKMKPEQAVACVAERAGRRGGTAWLTDLCAR